MKILAVFQLCLAGGEVLALQDNVGSYSHFLDTKSFIYNSGVGADLRGEKKSADNTGPRNVEEKIQEKRDVETDAQNTALGQGFYPGGFYSTYNPYVSPAWYLPVKDQRSLSFESQDDVYKREADLNGAPYPHLGLGVPPGVAPLYGFPYLHPYYSGHSLHRPAPQAAEREAVPVYVPDSPAPAPVYRYSPTPLPYTQVVPAPVPVYRYSPLAHPTPPPTAPAPPVQSAPSPTPVYLPPRVDAADVHHPVPGYPPHVPLTPAPGHYYTPHPVHPQHHVPTRHPSPTPSQSPHHVLHSHHLNPSPPPPPPPLHQVPVTLPPTIPREPQALPVPTFAPPVVRTSSLPRLHHDSIPHFNSIPSPNIYEKEDPFLPTKPFVPAQPSPRPGSPVFSRNPSLMSENLNHNQQRLENILRQHNQEQRMADEPPDAFRDPLPSLPPQHRPSPAPASVSNFSPPAPAPGPQFSQRPLSGRQQPPQFSQNRQQPRPQAPARPPPPQRPARPPQRFLSGSFQNNPASNTRPREGRALQKLLDVAGDDWDTEIDIDTNLMSSQTSDSFICPAREGNFPDPSSCSSYFTCDHGAAHRNSCGKGLVWNPLIEQCDWGSNVRCSSQI